MGSYPAGASPYGALDMAGNVWEWVADWYDEDYYARAPREDPQGRATGLNRVVRGGSWVNGGGYVRAAYRDNLTPGYRHCFIGYRCARSPSS